MNLEKDLLELLALFNSHHVDFLVVGDHAVAYHGHPRLTEDLDLFVRPELENGHRIVQALAAFCFGPQPVWIISKGALIRSKRATGRLQDLADAEFLERVP